MSDSAVKADVYLPVLCGGTLASGPSDGDVEQNVRGCSAVAVTDGAPIVYWSIVMERQDVPPERCVVLITAAGYATDPPYIPSYEWDGQGTLRISSFKTGAEDPFDQTLEATLNFSILYLPNR